MSNETEEMGDQSEPPSEAKDRQIYAAEYKDGQLQIIEVCPFDRGPENQNQVTHTEESIEPEEIEDAGDSNKYLQLLDTGKGLLQLDLLNFTLVKSENGSNTYQMVADGSSTANNGDTTITCVLSSDDIDDTESDHPESYVMVHTEDGTDQFMYLQTTNDQTTDQQTEESSPSVSNSDKPKQLTPVQILEKAKALQKAKSILGPALRNRRGRKRKGDLPTPMELLSSPNFKLYLYSCKLCSFKCNAIKEMSAHKASKHLNSNKSVYPRAATMQCPRCPYRAHSHTQLVKHARDVHTKEVVKNNSDKNNVFNTAVRLDSEKVEEADILVCGACGFESGDRGLFKIHIEKQHGATSVVLG